MRAGLRPTAKAVDLPPESNVGAPALYPTNSSPAPPCRPYEQWAMDFMQDTLADGHTVRILTVVDIYARECLAAVPAATFRGADVVRVLTQLGTVRSLPSASGSTTAPSSPRRRSTGGPTGTGSSSTSVDRPSPSTTPSSRRSRHTSA